MKKTYIFLSALLVILAGLLLVLPEKPDHTQLPPEKLLMELNDQTRFLSVDEVTHKIIDQDPEIQLVDVRTPDEYAQFTLPGAINIPLENLLEKDSTGYYVWEWYLNPESKKTIFFSNGNVYANQAWMLCRRLNFKNIFVMKGGLNQWFQKIILVSPPPLGASENQYDVYEFRKGARYFFTGGEAPAPESSAPKVQAPVKKKKTETVEGGC